MVMPIMNFPVYDPVGDTIDRGMSMSKDINSLIAQQLQNELMKETMPYDIRMQELFTKELEAYAPFVEQKAMNEALINNLDAQLRVESQPQKRAEISSQLASALMERDKQEYFRKTGRFTPEQQKVGGLMDIRSGIKPGSPHYSSQNQSGMAQVQQQNQQQRQIPGNLNMSQPGTSGQLHGEFPWSITGPQVDDSVSSVGQRELPSLDDQYSDLEISMYDDSGEWWEKYYIPSPTEEQKMDQYVLDIIEEESVGKAKSAGLKKREEMKVAGEFETLKDLRKRSETANSSNITLERMIDAWNTIPEWQKGWLGGNVPATSKEANIIDSGIAELLNEAQSHWVGTLSDKDIENIKKQFPGRKMTEQGFREVAEYIKKANERVLLRDKFYADHFEAGISERKIDQAWRKLRDENPIYVSTEDMKKEYEELRKRSGG